MTDLTEVRRAKFEAWFTENYTAHKLSPRQTNCGIMTNEYADLRVHMCWLAWQAALDSAVVELPEFYVDDDGHDNLDRGQVIEAIHAAGVRTK